MAGVARTVGVDAARYLARVHAGLLAADRDRVAGTPNCAAVEGTLVFADISGFTPLSERLARRGSAGAEELTDLVDAVVGRLLAVLTPWGGDLLKYGGDALLLLFDGAGHESRAAAAAAEMQAVLRDFRDVRSESGRITLRMAIGVEAGRVDLFLVGGDHRELLVAGPTVSRVVRCRRAAKAGEVVLGPRVAEVLPAECVGGLLEDGVVRMRTAPTCRQELPDGGPGAVAEEVALSGVPVALRGHLGAAYGEHRQAAVAFLQCRGLDEVVERDGPAAAARVLNDLVVAVQRACADHGVTFLATDVDVSAAKLILVTGAPTTLEDDEDRLVAAVRAVLSTPRPLPVRAGIHRGRVFAVEVGDDRRRAYTVLGSTVNLAARMMSAAPDGSVLATADVLDRLQVPYARRELLPFTVRGMSRPVRAALVGAPRRRAPAGLRPGDGPLVGRRAELATLLAAVDDARAGRVRVVEILGEPGIGKSRLLAEACASAGDLPVVLVQARQSASTQPYHALRDLFRLLLGLSPAQAEDEDLVAETLTARVRGARPELLPLLPLLGVPLGLQLPDTEAVAGLAPDFRRDQIHVAMLRFLDALMPPAGLLVVEDAYWLDDGSARLLTTLIGALEDHTWAVFVARRTLGPTLDLTNVPDVVRLEIRPLSADDAKTLAVTGGGFSRAEAGALVERSGGNPLFLKELAAAAARGTSVDELPDTVEAVIAAHLDTLDAGDRDLARVASVVGSRIPTELLLDLAGVDGADDRAATLGGLRRLAGVLEPEDGEHLRFTHSLLREGAYAGLPFRRRRQLHGRTADLVKAHAKGAEERQAATLSLHYHAAGRHLDSWRWSRVAAARARQAAAPVEAAALFGRAVESGRSAGLGAAELAAVWEQLGDVAELGALYAQAGDAYRRARRLRTGDAVAAGELLRKQGHVAEREGRYPVALRYYTQGFRALDRAGPPDSQRAGAVRVKVELTLAYGAARLRQGRYADAVRVLEEAVHRAEEIGHRRALAHAYYLLDWAHTDRGEPEPTYRALALPIYLELGDWLGQGNVLNNLGVDAYYEGRWDDALDLYRRSREAFERVGNAVLAATATNNVGEILSDQGHLDQARAEFEAALEVWQLSGYPIGVGLAKANLGRAAARAGDLAGARRLLAEAVAELRRIGADSLAVDAEAREAERLVLERNPAGAIDVAERARARAEQPVQRAFIDRLVGWARAQQGDMPGAREAFADSMRAAVAAGARYEEALTRLALVRVSTLPGETPTPATQSSDPVAAGILDRLGVVRTPLPPL